MKINILGDYCNGLLVLFVVVVFWCTATAAAHEPLTYSPNIPYIREHCYFSDRLERIKNNNCQCYGRDFTQQKVFHWISLIECFICKYLFVFSSGACVDGFVSRSRRRYTRVGLGLLLYYIYHEWITPLERKRAEYWLECTAPIDANAALTLASLLVE